MTRSGVLYYCILQFLSLCPRRVISLPRWESRSTPVCWESGDLATSHASVGWRRVSYSALPTAASIERAALLHVIGPDNITLL